MVLYDNVVKALSANEIAHAFSPAQKYIGDLYGCSVCRK